MYHFTLNVLPPDDFAHLQLRLAQSSQGAFYRILNGKVGRILRLPSGLHYVEIGPGRTPGNYAVTVRAGSVVDEKDVSRLLRHIFAFDVDLTRFYEHCKQSESGMINIVHALCGARMVRDPDVFTSVISTIISQQLNLKFAAELKHRMWSLCGMQVDVDDDFCLYADPLPEAIARLDYTQLREMQFSQRKAEYVIDFARLVVDEKVELERLNDMSDEAAIEYLSGVRGLGRWTAECVLIFGLGRQDLLPAKDVGLQRAASRMWRRETRVKEEELRQRAFAWSPWSSWYTYYLWLSDSAVKGK